jgi:hypothetical protein
VPNGNVSSNAPDAPPSGGSGWATHKSNSSPVSMYTFHNFNPDINFYYVQITLERNNPNSSCQAMGVFLR